MSVMLHRLSNGLRIVTENMPGLKSASVGIWVTAGGRHERVEQNGIAHFLEHMAFKGTETRSALRIAEEIEDVGGYINAYTSKEVTAYYARVLEADVPLALDVIADIVLNPVFDRSEIEVERGVILQEIGQTLDTPDDVIFDWLQDAAYPEQPLGRTILGPSDKVSAFERDDLAGFVREHYSPDRMIIAAAGAVDHDQIVKAAEKLFSQLGAANSVTQPTATFFNGERRQQKSLEQAHFAMAFESPGYQSDQIYAAQIFSVLFGGGMSSRLFQEIREKRGLCYTIYAQAAAYAETGMMTIYAGTSGEDVADLATLSMDELKRATSDLTQAEIDRARAQMKASMLMGLESPSSRAERLARMISIWDRVPDLEEMIEKIDAVTRNDVRDFAGSMITGEAALALYGPVEKAPSLAELRARLAA